MNILLYLEIISKILNMITKNHMPLLSIVICTYNRPLLLMRALNSVIKQTFKDCQIIVIDDASTDNTKEVVKEYIDLNMGVEYYRNDHNLGVTKSRNRGCSIAKGKYIAMLDSDDWWSDNDKLAKQVAILEANPQIGVLGTGINMCDDLDNVMKKRIFNSSDEDIRKEILFNNQFCQSSVMFRKDAYIAAGGYDESLVVLEDFDLWLRIGLRYKLANIPEILTSYFINPEGICKLQKKRLVKTNKMLIERYKLNYPGYMKAKFRAFFRRFV